MSSRLSPTSDTTRVSSATFTVICSSQAWRRGLATSSTMSLLATAFVADGPGQQVTRAELGCLLVAVRTGVFGVAHGWI